MQPREATSSHEALGWIERGDPFDIALLGLPDSGADGLELATQMRARRNVAALALVLLVPLVPRSDALRAVEHRVQAILSKPLKLSQ